ncbi:restriction endonuclease subunit S [Xylella fastidiosa]|uniref:Restriction endonuclease subunit S n=1 Tax=Xylella fastidiosa subsp. fastidiosa TaxID=644356 RepID=A0AAJ5UIQ8_XYLFS|nr:restriction endonuclease subunit S [Xylella fastidiosa]WCF28301.1 restriction endonuclease subunit S [Xylella fastidiosa subsp. fastidiosa]
MSRIDELIAALCPEGVEFKRLGEIFDMKAGKFISSNEISKNQDEHFLYPCYGGNGIRGFVRQNNQEGKYILIGRVGACGNVKRTHGKFFVTDNAVICDSKVEVDIDWAFHLLSVMNLNQYAMKSAQPVLAVRTIEQVKVPLPPLEVQRQIVKVLDTFTTLEAELEAELETRRRQYQYYRDALLTFGEGTDAATRVRWMTLGEICQINRGRVMSKDYLRDNVGSYPVYSSQTANDGVFGFIDTFDYDFESITWTTDGANAGSLFYHCDKKIQHH